MSRIQSHKKRLRRTSSGIQAHAGTVAGASDARCEESIFVPDELNEVHYRKCGATAKFVLQATRNTTRKLCPQYARKYLNRRPQAIARL